MINAPFYGFSKRINNISQAVSLFGVERIYGFCLKYFLNEKVIANLNPYAISTARFNTICHMQSDFMLKWYSKIDLEYANFLSNLALIMETGKLIICKEVVANASIAEFKKGFLECENMSAYEDKIFGTTSYYLGGALFEYWNLNPLYATMLKGLDYGNESIDSKMDYYIDVLHIVRTVVNVKEVFTKESIKKASIVVENIGLNKAEFINIANKMARIYN